MVLKKSMSSFSKLLTKLKESKISWKYILIMMILLILVFFITSKTLWKAETQRIFLIEFSPTQELKKIADEIADWKSYKNEKYKFEFKYPKEYDICELCKIRETDNVIELDEGRFKIEIIETTEESLLEYVNNFVCKVKKELGILELSREELAKMNLGMTIEEIFIGNIKGYKITYPGRGKSAEKYIFLSKDNKIYQISRAWWGVTDCLGYAYHGAAGYEECKGKISSEDYINFLSEPDVFEQIPFTFRFLD